MATLELDVDAELKPSSFTRKPIVMSILQSSLVVLIIPKLERLSSSLAHPVGLANWCVE